jgi:hypothetical protein
VMDLNNNIARMMPGSDNAEGKQRVQGLFVRDQTKSGGAPANAASAGDRKHP